MNDMCLDPKRLLGFKIMTQGNREPAGAGFGAKPPVSPSLDSSVVTGAKIGVKPTEPAN